MRSNTEYQSEGAFRKLKSSFNEIFGKLETPKLETQAAGEKITDRDQKKAE